MNGYRRLLIHLFALPLNYQEVRFRWCRAQLFAFLRKWGIYIVIGAVVLGSSGTDPIATMTGLVSASVLPLLWSLQHPPWGWVLATVAYGTLGAMLCRSMRGLFWSIAWRDIELSLPIEPSDKRRSDLVVVILALSPFYLLFAAGLLNWALKQHVGQTTQQLLAAIMLIIAFAASVICGLLMLSAMRRVPQASAIAERADHPSATMALFARYPSIYALIFVPLIRGPAKRAGKLLKLALLILLLHFLLYRFPTFVSWWLALFALLTQLMTTRLTSVLDEDLRPLHSKCEPLPISINQLRWIRLGIAAIPATIGFALIFPILFVAVENLRSSIGIAFVLFGLSANLLETALCSRARTPTQFKASTRAGLWIVILVIQIALASELTP
ncbi:MAG: hypothetical protein HYS18_07600 [Burkholderiales bacterium]|nr:hypothetical protein [Burkholderiales bacterium]